MDHRFFFLQNSTPLKTEEIVRQVNNVYSASGKVGGDLIRNLKCITQEDSVDGKFSKKNVLFWSVTKTTERAC